MRSLSESELDLVRSMIGAMPIEQANGIRMDLEHSKVEEQTPDGARLKFIIPGYDRPPYLGQHAFPIEGKMQDGDGADLHVILYADESNRLLELEFIRWAGGVLVGPKWSTLTIEP